MLYLDSESKKDMNIYINCSGGDVVPCLAIHDTMRHIKSDVGTVGFGGCMGMSGFLLAVGKKVGGCGECGVKWLEWLCRALEGAVTEQPLTSIAAASSSGAARLF
jgi:hypothetical protein